MAIRSRSLQKTIDSACDVISLLRKNAGKGRITGGAFPLHPSSLILHPFPNYCLNWSIMRLLIMGVRNTVEGMQQQSRGTSCEVSFDELTRQSRITRFRLRGAVNGVSS